MFDLSKGEKDEQLSLKISFGKIAQIDRIRQLID